MMAGALLAATLTPALGASSPPQCGPGFEHDAVMGCARGRANGHWDVQLSDGSIIQTHGPDARAAFIPGDDGEAAVVEDSSPPDVVAGEDLEPVATTDQNPLAPGAPQRAPECRPAGLFRFVALYSYPAGGTNAATTARPLIRDTLGRASYFVNQESLRSSNEQIRADLEFRCTDAGDEISIPQGFAAPVNATWTELRDAAVAAGHNDGHEKYIIFADWNSTVCGLGELYANHDERLSTNVHNHGPSDPALVTSSDAMYSAIYARGCWEGSAPLHELTHTMGAVQNSAPDTTSAGHCNDEIDVMCYDDSGAGGTTVQCADLKYDCTKDTYFDTDTTNELDTTYLNTKWNIGWDKNRFVFIRP